MEGLGKLLEESRVVHAAVLAEAQLEPNDQVVSFFDDLFQATSASFQSLLRPTLTSTPVVTEKRVPVDEEDTFFGNMFYLSSDDAVVTLPSQNNDKVGFISMTGSISIFHNNNRKNSQNPCHF